MEWHDEAMEYGACHAHDLAGRLAARLEERPTRWSVPFGYARPGEDREPAGVGNNNTAE